MSSFLLYIILINGKDSKAADSLRGIMIGVK